MTWTTTYRRRTASWFDHNPSLHRCVTIPAERVLSEVGRERTSSDVQPPSCRRARSKEKPMLDRRNFLTTAGAATVLSSLSRGFTAPPDEAQSSGDGTWLTYAVNVEMTWGKLPF